MKTLRDQYTDETGYMDFEYSDGWETYYTASYGNWLESKLNECHGSLREFLDDNLQKSKNEGLQNKPFGQGWISALMHVKVNYLDK